jgi:hypothetical protein
MMMLRKTTKPRAPEPAPAASQSIEEQIRAARQAAERFVEARVRAIKASPEGESLPINSAPEHIRPPQGSRLSLPLRALLDGREKMTDEDRKKQAAVLAEIAALPPGTSIEEWNERRFTAIIIIPEKQKLH